MIGFIFGLGSAMFIYALLNIIAGLWFAAGGWGGIKTSIEHIIEQRKLKKYAKKKA